MTDVRGKFLNWRQGEMRNFLSFFLMAFLAGPVLLYAQGQITIAKPVDHSISDNFHVRKEHPVSGEKNVPHWGTDFRTPCGTPVPMKTGGNLICPNSGAPSGGAGIIGNVDHGCGITEAFFHLQSCTSAGMISGNTGKGTGCHLHHEVYIDGVKVNPERAYSAGNLCDPETKKKLIEESKNDMNGRTTAGGGAGTNTGGAPAPPTQGGTTYVPPGGIDPITGRKNNGGGYYIVDHGDGRTEIIPDLGNGNPDLPGIPTGTPPNLTPSTSTNNEVTGCATDTWRAMVNQSVMQSRREMIANQTFITKQDSVMAYACLTEHVENVYKNLGPIFSETKYWVNRDVDILGRTVTINKELGDSSLDGAITNAAIEPYEEWMANYFSHDFLGGKEAGSSANHGDHAHAEDQAYTPCGAMAVIWKMAKCTNVYEDPLFYRFEDLISNDPRQFPEGYACNNTGFTQDQIDLAKGRRTGFDAVRMHYDLLSSGEDGACAPPVMTGVTVTRKIPATDGAVIAQEESYEDGLCLTAGCSFQRERGAQGGGTCVVK